jgi:hypothetical protein
VRPAAVAVCWVVAASCTVAPAHAQTSWSVATPAELTTALAGAFTNNVSDPSIVNTITLSGNISGSSQWIVNANVNIVGQGYTIDMSNADRAFFIAGGTVGMSNFTIRNGRAAGGNGGFGGGGGAGLGGGIFVGSGTYSGWTTNDNPQPIVAALGVSVPTVTLSGVSFANNTALGGGSTFSFGNGFASGGGGMGGNGSDGGGDSGGGGGGGFGNSATAGGGTGSNGAAGAFVNVNPTSGNTLAAGSGGSGGSGSGGAGGANGGGGGGGGGADLTFAGAGGGGGVGAGRGYFTNDTPPNNGGFGGFGGGGGGNAGAHGSAGNGGFGGGGGGSLQSGGNGGFGGGGGKASSGSPGAGGFGAASATPTGGTGQDSAAGGGLGAGGAVFVMAGASVTLTSGSFASNTVTGGSGGNGNNGSAYGADMFLGGTVFLSPGGFEPLVVGSLGGAGNLADPNVASHANDPNAQGGIVVNGSGEVMLTGSSFYSGPTTIAGALTFAANSGENGTSLVVASGSRGQLNFGSSSWLTLGGFNPAAPQTSTDLPVQIAPDAASVGQITIGQGQLSNVSGAFIGARVFNGGPGDATLVWPR